jgi:hypothetical protein
MGGVVGGYGDGYPDVMSPDETSLIGTSLLKSGPWDKAPLGQNITWGQTVHPRFFLTKRTKCPRHFRDVLSFLTRHCHFLK